MRRREFLTLFAGGAAGLVPLHAPAQDPGKIWRIGVLDTASANLNAANLESFRSALSQLGYVEGRNLTIVYRSSEGRIERFPELAADLVRLNVDLILTRGTPATIAAGNASKTTPIVMASIGDPLETGLVASLARPGGNVTGLSAFVTELTAKRIEVMRDLLPKMSRMTMMDNMANRSVPPQWREMERAALALGIQARMFDIRKFEDIEPAFQSAMAERTDAIAIGNDSVTLESRHKIAELAAKHRVPAIYATREFVDAGGLISYAANYSDLYARAATFVHKIFKGAKPGELPVEQPTKFELVINLNAAKALGLVVPPTLLSRADQVIE